MSPQVHKVNGVKGATSGTPDSALHVGSYSLDRELLKKLGMGFALAAAILAFIVEKLF